LIANVSLAIKLGELARRKADGFPNGIIVTMPRVSSASKICQSTDMLGVSHPYDRLTSNENIYVLEK
jgi:hypothetical protein